MWTYHALAAASVELMAMVTASLKGMKNVVFSIGKALSGVLGGISAHYMANMSFLKAEEEESKGNYGVKNLLKVSGYLYNTVSLLTILAASSYHIVWCRRFLTTRATFWVIKMLGKGVGVQKIASMAALRLALWRFAGLVGLVVMVLDFAVTMLSDDNLETWLKRCALRADKYLMPHNKSHIYQTPQQQTIAFETEELKDMFDINKNESQANNNTNYTIDIDEALALIEQDMDERGFLNG